MGNENNYVALLSICISGVIALVGAAIAFSQYRLNMQTHKFKLYDKRLQVYLAVKDFLSSLSWDGQVSTESIKNFSEKIAEGTLLFDKHIREQIDTIYKEARVNAHLARRETMGLTKKQLARIFHKRSGFRFFCGLWIIFSGLRICTCFLCSAGRAAFGFLGFRL